ncbi:hypothetical protein IQ266_27525 [filamentous cyanobacterium LEGE 11480]|uniref:Uncharacterized protein n=1 Tax=Romeriopsis navalis LEGE 11480 TaxID=2777977 RepID=A0A928Z7U0_9CYAN|nr:hypothetical protein [Romeriopsis navalis]MBE9033485.1 hypothetical protein [Romeriopsis navalis LEGE 11480]
MNAWQPIEAAFRTALIAQGLDPDEWLEPCIDRFVGHLTAGKDFQVGVEETIDSVIYYGQPEEEDCIAA